MRTTYQSLFSSSDSSLWIRLVPTDLDQTMDFERDHTVSSLNHQKGADLLIYDMTPEGNCPILLIDVTLGNDSTIRKKNSHTLLQAQTATPVLIMGLGNSHMLPENNNLLGNYGQFLDSTCPQVGQGVKPPDILRNSGHHWFSHLKNKLLASINSADDLLGISNYPHSTIIDTARGKLERAKEVLCG